MSVAVKRKLWLVGSLIVVGVIVATAPIAAQNLRNGTISGTMTDDTGAALPGVTVTVTSPALQVPQLVTSSGPEGNYQFIDLPVGTYRIKYELSGFGTLVREDIRITTGFAARIDAILRVATLEETVTVRGDSPLVDVSTTRGGGTVTRDVLVATPNNLNHQDVFLLVAGVQINAPPLTGEVGTRNLAANNFHKAYGQTARTNNEIEGLKTMPGEAPDFGAVEEVDIRAYGNSAEVDVPGATMQLIFRSGGNQYHGRYTAKAQHHRWQASNLDDALRAQGIAQGDALRYYSEVSADLGGRIVRNKLWFYGAVKDLRNERTGPGYADDAGPDGVYGTLDDTPGTPIALAKNATLKLSYQATGRHKFIGFTSWNKFDENELNASRFIPFESTTHYIEVPRQAKIEWQGLMSDRLLFTMMVGSAGYVAERRIHETSIGIPNRFNRETGFQTGASFESQMGIRRPWRQQWTGGLTYYPKRAFVGSHQIAAGYRIWWGSFGTDFPSQETGYRLLYDRVLGVANQPVELHTYNFPLTGESRQNVYAAHVSDTWNLSKRLTLNLGFRWEHSTAFVEEQTKVQGRFGSAGEFPKVDAGSLSGVAPRLGVAFDVTGDGKTVVKGTYGWYNHSDFERVGVALEFAQLYNQNAVTTAVYRWRDLDGNNDYTPGEVNLDPNGPDFLSVTGATNNVVNPNLKWPRTHEISTSLERELFGNLSVRGLYVYKKVTDQIGTVNNLRPYNVYNQALTRRDPGPDGTLNTGDDGGLVTFYDYDPAYRGSRFVANMLTNGDRDDSYNNIEFTLTRRPVGGWFAMTSLLATKYHRWLSSVAQSPNDDIFPLDDTWELGYRLAAGYEMPRGIRLSTVYQAYTGTPNRRTYIFRAADPDGGRALPSSGSLTLPMEAFGAQRDDSRHNVNIGAAKDFRIGAGRKLTGNFEVYNLLNSNTAWGGINYQSGPTFGYVNRIVSPRAVRLGVTFEF